MTSTTSETEDYGLLMNWLLMKSEKGCSNFAKPYKNE